jgi:hypothetical protein
LALLAGGGGFGESPAALLPVGGPIWAMEPGSAEDSSITSICVRICKPEPVSDKLAASKQNI